MRPFKRHWHDRFDEDESRSHRQHHSESYEQERGWDQRGPFRFMPRGQHPGHEWFGRGGPFGGDPSGKDGGRQRQRRGDIKYALLELLAEQPRHGYDLIKELEQRYGGFYRPSPGSVYPTLQLLEDEGYLTSATADGKRVYTITEAGQQFLQERQQQAGPADPRRGGRRGSPEVYELRERSGALMESLMQVGRHGTPAQIAAVAKLIDSTRRDIYAILSQPESTEPPTE